MHVSGVRRARITTGGEARRCVHTVRRHRHHSNQGGNHPQTYVRIQTDYHSPGGKFRAAKTRMKSGVHSAKRLRGIQGPWTYHQGLETTRSGVSSAYFEVIMISYNFNNRHAVSPQNPNGFGKAGTQATARITVSIPGYFSMDYTRIPISYSAQGNVRARTVGRY